MAIIRHNEDAVETFIYAYLVCICIYVESYNVQVAKQNEMQFWDVTCAVRTQKSNCRAKRPVFVHDD